MVIQLSDIIVIENEDFTIRVEEREGLYFLHCDCYSWSLSVLKRLYREAATIEAEVRALDIKVVYSISPNPKFCEILGAINIGQLEEHGITYEVMEWEL